MGKQVKEWTPGNRKRRIEKSRKRWKDSVEEVGSFGDAEGEMIIVIIIIMTII